MYDSIPFGMRVGALFALFTVVAGAELAFRGRAASRWKEYLFLFGAGLAGAVYGVLNDLATSSISPCYFSLLKQIPSGPEFREGVIHLGASAGFCGGALAACALLYANNRHSAVPQLSYGRLAGLALLPASAMLLGSVAGAAIGTVGPWHTHVSSLFPDLDPAATESLGTVWAVHIGLYLGLLVGTIVAFRRIRRLRRGYSGASTNSTSTVGYE